MNDVSVVFTLSNKPFHQIKISMYFYNDELYIYMYTYTHSVFYIIDASSNVIKHDVNGLLLKFIDTNNFHILQFIKIYIQLCTKLYGHISCIQLARNVTIEQLQANVLRKRRKQYTIIMETVFLKDWVLRHYCIVFLNYLANSL